MASAGYGPVNGGKRGREDEDELVDEWGVRYEGHNKPGGGTFSRHRRPRRKYFYLAGAAIVIFLIIVIIAVAVQRHSSPQEHHEQQTPVELEGKWKDNSQEGITFYPVPGDGSTLIKYDSHKPGREGYQPLVESMERVLHDYKLVNTEGDEYVDCTNTSAPADKVCRFDLSVFRGCDEHHKFGYQNGRPCILLQLNLPRNKTAVPFEKSSEVAKKLGENYSPDYIGVTCDGKTDEDRQHMSVHDPAEPIVQYFPREGFPAYWFRPRSIDKFLAPIVMVRFNTVQDATNVQVKCTAWGKNFNGGKPDNSTLYSSTFTIYHI